MILINLVHSWFLHQSFIQELYSCACHADKIAVMICKFIDLVKHIASNWLRQGLSPQRLALTFTDFDRRPGRQTVLEFGTDVQPKI